MLIRRVDVRTSNQGRRTPTAYTIVSIAAVKMRYGLYNADVWEVLVAPSVHDPDFLVRFVETCGHVYWSIFADREGPGPPEPAQAFLRGNAPTREAVREMLLDLANRGSLRAARQRTDLGKMEW